MNSLHRSLASALMAGLAGGAQADSRTSYIVQLADEPAATYSGTVAGYRPTTVAPGRTFNAAEPSVRAYRNYLESRQTSVASTVGAPVIHKYSVVLNGFAARLTTPRLQACGPTRWSSTCKLDEDAPARHHLDARLPRPDSAGRRLVADPRRHPDQGRRHRHRHRRRRHLAREPGLRRPRRRQRQAGAFSGGNAGLRRAAGQLEGHLRGRRGLHPGHALQQQADRRAATTRPASWQRPDAALDRIRLAARLGRRRQRPRRPRHHTSTTAGGNSRATARRSAASRWAPRRASRRAPASPPTRSAGPTTTRQRPTAPAPNSCYTSDSVAAIDKAVADGVNVINYSISGSQTSVNDPVELAFLARRGRRVRRRLGRQQRPGASAVAHISPWLTTVAASTHDRYTEADVDAGQRHHATPARRTSNVGAAATAPLIRAEDAGLAAPTPA